MLLPVGELTKAEVRRLAMDLDLRTAQKPEVRTSASSPTSTAERRSWSAHSAEIRRGRRPFGEQVGQVDSVEMVTIGQRKGLGLAGGTDPKYVVDVDVTAEGDRRVMIGEKADLVAPVTELESWRWVGEPVDGSLRFQCSAHGRSSPAGSRTAVRSSGMNRIAASQPGSRSSVTTPTMWWSAEDRRSHAALGDRYRARAPWP